MSNVTIRDIRTIFTEPDGIRLVIVKIETSEPGLYGIGCATFTQRPTAVKTALDDYLRLLLVGRDVADIEDVWQSSYVSSYWRNGPVLNNAMSGVDQALWDIKGKMAGMPVYDLFGGKAREAAAVYVHAKGAENAEVEDEVRSFMAEGYHHIRVQIETPGGFATRRDYQGTDVLVTGRGLAVAPWFLVRTVTAVEALSAIDSRARTLLIVFLGLIAGIAVALVAVWRHGTSLRAAEAAERHRLAAEQFANVTRFLRVVTDALPNPMMAVDGDGRYMFSNMAAAEEAGLHPRDMIGKDLASVMGPVRARLFQRINNRVMADQEPATEYHAFSDDGAEGAEGSEIAVKSDHLPIAATSRRPAGVLMRLEDITEITEQRRRGERIMRQLVQTLLGVVDRRDPYSANHSARLAEVAKAIAREMGLDDLECATVETAGNLINLGKILIPIELLTKTEDLTDEERDSLQNSVVVSADLLEGVEFDGPVVATIRQMQEHWDGTGPEAVAGEAIEGGARIVAVANAFVGMVSARAWRRAMPFDQACKVLSDQAGTVFDRRPVSALINFIDNRGGRDRWASWGEAPEEGAGDTTS